MASQIHRTHRGVPLDFTRHCYLIDLYQDPHGDIRIRKSTQSGVSEYEWCWAMAKCDDGQSVFWVFPTEAIRNQLVHDRFDRTVAYTDYYSRLTQAAKRGRRMKEASDAVALKQFGHGSIALVPSNSVVSFKSFSADCAIVDELDQCDADNLPMIEDRMAHSVHRTKLRVGNPTIAGFGIDALYAESDQRSWRIKCDHCGTWQTPDWFANVAREIDEGRYEPRLVVSELIALACASPNCGKALDRFAAGEWIAAYPGRTGARGYHISQLFSGSVSLGEMWAAFQRGQSNETERQRFYNSVLGLPYVAEGAKLTEARLLKATGDYARQSVGESCFIGVDVGSLLHVCVIDQQGRLVQAATVRQFAEVDELISAFGAALCVVDMLPETREARQFADRFPGRVLLCQFVVSEQVKDFAVEYSTRIVKAHRTQTLDDSHAALLNGKATLPQDAASIKDFYPQMMAPTRVFDEKRQTFKWLEGGQPDHYRHAFNYAWLARSIRTRHGAGVVVL